jgi:glyoxylase-like metal-dependent hydrolase (beta-lactamase superfamily II)
MINQPYKVFEDVYMVGSSDVSHSMDCCIYLVDAGDLVLIDAGAGKSTSRLIDNIQALGFQPEKLSAIIVTHAHIDHIGSLHDLKELYGVKIIAHKEDAEAIGSGSKVGAAYYGIQYKPCKVDIILQGEENRLTLGSYGFNMVHIPGHTPGSMAVTMEMAGKRVLFGQDIHGPYHPDWGGDVDKAAGSLVKLRDIKADILCEGHYGVIKPGEKVSAFIQGFIDDLQ